MGTSIETRTFTIQNSDKKITIKCEKRGYADAILGRFINGTITEAEAQKLQQAAASAHGKDATVIEACEIDNKLCQEAAQNGYYEYYDLIEQEGFLKARVRETGLLFPDPDGKDIKKDFGLKNNVLFTNNEKLFLERKGIFLDENGPWANFTEFNAGDVLKMPKAEVKLQEKPRGFLSRFFNQN